MSSPCEESFKWLITTQHAVVFTLWSLHILSSCACSTSGPKARVFSSLLMLNWLWRLFKDLLDFWCNLAPNVSSQSSVSDAFVRWPVLFTFSHFARASDPPPRSRFSADGFPVPTHFYTVITSCQEVNQTVDECDGALKVFSFLLPNKPDNSEACNVSKNEFMALWSFILKGKDPPIIPAGGSIYISL